MMEKWNGCPAVLKRRICFTLLAGPASVIVSLIIYLAYADTVLLTMSGAIFICCLYRGKVLWDIIRREAYIAVSGTCTGVTLSPLRRYRRVRRIWIRSTRRSVNTTRVWSTASRAEKIWLSSS